MKTLLLVGILSAVGMAADQLFQFVGIDRTDKDSYVGYLRGDRPNASPWAIKTRGCNQMAARSMGAVHWDNATDTGVIEWIDGSYDPSTKETKYWSIGQCQVVELHSTR